LILNDNRDRLIATAQKGEEAAQVLAAWRQANANQFDMGNKILIQNSQQLQGLVENLRATQGELKRAIDELKQLGGTLQRVLSVVNAAVSLGTQVVGLA
jgi:hypothetical protein